MALFHRATITPTKEQVIAAWAPTQPWGPSADAALEVIGSYRFDDPDGRVGMESFLVRAGGGDGPNGPNGANGANGAEGPVFHVPLTYRDEPLDGADDALISKMEHSVLGDRWVYDGLRDPLFTVMLAAVAMTGQGEALGMAVYDGRWYIAPSKVRIHGGGWTQARVPVDGFAARPGDTRDTDRVVLGNDRFDLVVWRRPVPGPRPAIGLRAAWDGAPDPVVLAEVRER